MSEGSCRITVVGPARRADLTLPADVAVAELIPDLVQILDGDQQADAAPRRWSLLRVGGGALDLERSLAAQTVLDGAMVFLRDTSTPPQPPVVEDIVESVAIAVDVRPGRWTASAARVLWTAVAAACAAAAAWECQGAPDGVPRAALALGAALLLLVAAGAVLRTARQPVPGAALALAALPLWAVGGAAASTALDLGGTAALAGAAAAVVVGALAACLAAPPAVAPAAGVAALALPVAVAVAAGAALQAGVTQEAAVLAVVALVVTDQLPRVATLLAGLSAAGPGPAATGPELRARVDRGHRTLAWLHAGAALALAGALVGLALSSLPLAWALGAVTALAVALRTRRFRFTAEVVPLAVAALVGPLTLEAVLARWLRVQGTGGTAAAIALALATAALALAVALSAPRLAGSSPGRRRLLDVLELVANLALVPLVIGVLGVFALVYESAHRMA